MSALGVLGALPGLVPGAPRAFADLVAGAAGALPGVLARRAAFPAALAVRVPSRPGEFLAQVADGVANVL